MTDNPQAAIASGHTASGRSLRRKLSNYVSLKLNAHRCIIACYVLGCTLLLLSRYKTVFTVTFDMGIQLNATENLLANGGLFSDHFTPQDPDLSVPGKPPILTWFPPGYSVAIASIRVLGVSPSAALKVFDLSVLGLGLMGWGYILLLVLRQSKDVAHARKYLAAPWAICLPLFLSPWSGGTDCVLWATSAWTIVCGIVLVRDNRWVLAPVIAGFIVGVSMYFRYAAIYLTLFTGACLVLRLRDGILSAIKPGLVFSVAFLGTLTPLYLFNAIAQNGTASPPYTYQNPFTNDFFATRSYEIATGMAKANCLWGISRLDEYLTGPVPGAAMRIASGLGVLAICATVCLVTLRRYVRSRDDSVSLIVTYALFAAVLALLGFLIIPSIGTSYNSIQDGRYYMPLLPALQLGILGIALNSARWKRFAQVGAYIFLAAFTIEAFFLKAQSHASFPINYTGSRAPCESQAVLSWLRGNGFQKLTEPARTDLDLHLGANEARPILDEIKRSDPTALFFVQEPPYFHFDKPRARILGIPEQYFWDRAYVSNNANIYLFSTGRSNEIVSSIYKMPISVTDHLAIEVIRQTDNWTVRKVSAPAGTKLFLNKP